MSYDRHCPHSLSLERTNRGYEFLDQLAEQDRFAEYQPPESDLDRALRLHLWPFIYCIMCGFPLFDNDELCPRCNPEPQEDRP